MQRLVLSISLLTLVIFFGNNELPARARPNQTLPFQTEIQNTCRPKACVPKAVVFSPSSGISRSANIRPSPASFTLMT